MQFTTIGAAIVDIVVSRVLPMRAAKQDVDHIGLYAGGGAVNAALNMAARGARVTIHACVGRDLEGDLLRDLLRRHGIQTAIPDHALPTGKAVVMVDETGAARAYAQRGASAWVGEQGFPGLEMADVVYVTGLSLESQAWLELALARMAASRPRLVVTPGARQLADPQALRGLWDRADLLCVNAREAARLCGDAALDTDAPALDVARDLARRLLRRPGQSVLVTLGQGGALFHDGEHAHFHPARIVAPQSTIGAGDAFASAFVHAWAGGAVPMEALAAAADSAARVIQVIPANLAGPLRA
ncbi:carbohydrate kinase family protein [Castellaniella ginsengisoli]|uniref:Carbohydrate kinase family protein n=1 Tax=Castellaniella ginsengisoli TaxID=546114 RepID=A0AB39D9R5_9BURK